MAITRLALSNPPASTDTLLYTSNRNALVSVIATNKSASSAMYIRIWVKPSGATTESEYSYLAYDVTVPIVNTLETFRVPVMNGDEVYVRSSTANASFSLNGIYESNGTSHITVGTSAPSSPAIGDVFVNTTTNGVLYWTGSSWVNGTVDTSLYPFSVYQSTPPSSPVTGQFWVDSDNQSTYIWSGSAWLALSNPDTVTLNATQTITNKTLTSPVINGGSTSGSITNTATVSGGTYSSPVINAPLVASNVKNVSATTYSFILADQSSIITSSAAGATTFTIPLNTSVNFPIGSSITIARVGAADLTIDKAVGVTVVAVNNLYTVLSGYSVTLVKTDTNTWIMMAGGASPKAVVSSHTASSTSAVTIAGVSYTVYKFTATGSITFSNPGFVDVLVQGGGGPGNVVDAAGGAGGGGGQVEKSGVYVTNTSIPIRVGTGTGVYLASSNPAGTSEFNGIAAVGGAPAAQYNDRMVGGGACGSTRANGIGSNSMGMYYQGRIGTEMRGGNANSSNGPAGGVAGDNNALGYDPGADWGSPGMLGCGGNGGYPMTANTGNGGNNGANGNSGVVLIRVRN